MCWGKASTNFRTPSVVSVAESRTVLSMEPFTSNAVPKNFAMAVAFHTTESIFT